MHARRFICKKMTLIFSLLTIPSFHNHLNVASHLVQAQKFHKILGLHKLTCCQLLTCKIKLGDMCNHCVHLTTNPFSYVIETYVIQ
jgi:cbb3-type cytochrome oxidase cytochrome c subunit